MRLPYKVHNADGRLVAATEYGEDAARLVAGCDGWTVNVAGIKVWAEGRTSAYPYPETALAFEGPEDGGSSVDRAGESFDDAASTMLARLAAGRLAQSARRDARETKARARRAVGSPSLSASVCARPTAAETAVYRGPRVVDCPTCGADVAVYGPIDGGRYGLSTHALADGSLCPASRTAVKR